MQSEAKVHVTGNVYRHNLYTHYIGKTHLISQRLSPDMPKLNQNQRIQALTMLARGNNVSNVSRAFSCHRNTIILLRQRFRKQVGWQIAVDPVDRGLQTLERTGSLRLRTFDVVFKRRQVLQDSTVSANIQCCVASGKPGNPFGQGGPMWDKCLQHVIGLLLCSEHNGISVGGDSSGIGFYSLMGLCLTLVIMTVEFEFLEEKGNILLIIVSLRGTDLEVGVTVWGGNIGRRKTNLIVVQGNLNAQGYINQILQPEAVPFLQRQRQYRCMIMQDLMLQGYVDSF